MNKLLNKILHGITMGLLGVLTVALISCTVVHTQNPEMVPVYTMQQDTVITSQVRNEFIHSNVIFGSHIQVSSLNGVVELTGFVRTPKQSRDAENLARAVPDVRGVVNNLVITNHLN